MAAHGLAVCADHRGGHKQRIAVPRCVPPPFVLIEPETVGHSATAADGRTVIAAVYLAPCAETHNARDCVSLRHDQRARGIGGRAVAARHLVMPAVAVAALAMELPGIQAA